MKKIKKFLAVATIATMFFNGLPTKSVSASVRATYEVVRETKTFKTTKSETEDKKYVFTHNKKTNEVSFSVYSKADGSLISNQIVDIDDYEKSSKHNNTSKKSDFTTLSSSSYNQNTFSNYEYTIYFGSINTYELRRPDGSLNGTYYFTTRSQPNYNSSYIEGFMANVESINGLEGKLITSMGLAAVLAGISIALSGGAAAAFWTPYFASLTADVTSINYAIDLDTQCNYAYINYMNAFNHQY